MSNAKKTSLALIAAGILISGATAFSGNAEARVDHRHKRTPHAAATASNDTRVISRNPPQTGVVGYFGPPPFFGYGYGYGAPRGDVGFGLLEC